MVTFIPMTESEFQIYLKRSIEEYAQEHVKAGNWDSADALLKAEKEFQQLLPNGLASEKHYLFSIVDNNNDIKIGLIWFAEELQASRRSAFIYDFLIYKEYQRKGYGSQALTILEEKVKELGIETISLHVFGHNRAAIDLYQKAGFEITDLNMSKKLSH